MLLTDELIDSIHAFRVALTARYAESLKGILPTAAGCAIGSGFAVFAGEGSPRTQAYGLGHRDAPVDLSELDAFYGGLAKNWELIVTPFDSQDLLRQAAQLGYVPGQFESVLGQVVPADIEVLPGFEIEEITGDLTLWTQVSDTAWIGRAELRADVSDIGALGVVAPARRYLAWVDGQPAAIAAMAEFGGKFKLTGAATRPQFRGRGFQLALTQRRLCDAGPGAFLHVVALPGSQSHRNLQRAGFQPLYSKLVLFRHGY